MSRLYLEMKDFVLLTRLGAGSQLEKREMPALRKKLRQPSLELVFGVRNLMALLPYSQ
jgi:hypothetical protein